MQFKLETSALSQISADTVVLGIFQDEKPEKVIQRLDKTFSSSFLKSMVRFAQDEEFIGKNGQLLQLPTQGQIQCKKLVLWGLGKSEQYAANNSRKLAANLARRLNSNGANKSLSIYLRAKDSHKKHVQAAIEGWILGAYKFTKYKSVDQNGDARKSAVVEVTISGAQISSREFNEAVNAGAAIAQATNLARDLIAEPACYMTPTRLAQEAKKIARGGVVSCTVMDREQFEKLGMGSFIGVAKGAKEPPKFIVLKYSPPKAKRSIAVIGKGITFDSGGLSIKPAQSMEHMKYDMSGASVVLGTMQWINQLQPNVAVMGIIAATENMPGSAALHPGDVLTAMNGKTIEVNNTDAEGRLILADALVYACQQQVDEIIDIATLTGACVTALGRAAAGIMGNDQKLIDKLIESADEAGEKLWQLPLFDEYKDYLKSDIADLKNAGARGEAGSSAAAMFLKEFVDGRPWAHLDIAGPGWIDKDKDEINKGGTAFGVRTLARYILRNSS